MGDKTPLQEAGLFAADRLDHSHTWIKPRLERGEVVVSDRNIHSSIIYQGVVGELGIDTVCQVNSASMIPDLVVWIDCDPDRAIERIKHATLRMSSDKQEYFETPEIQKTIRRDLMTSLPARFKSLLHLTNAASLAQSSTKEDWMNYVRNLGVNYGSFSTEDRPL